MSEELPDLCPECGWRYHEHDKNCSKANRIQKNPVRDELLISLAVGIEVLLRKMDRFWPESREGYRTADDLQKARENFAKTLDKPD
jgi:hypothetical protein